MLKVRTSPYHTQSNGQVEWVHQMLMCMIGKLSRDWKADWPKHLPELVHAYTSMKSAITGYSSHYLMCRCQLYLPIDFYFPSIRDTEEHWHVNSYVTKLHELLSEAFKEVQVQSISEAERQKWYYDKKANTISPETVNLIFAKADAYKEMRKVKDWWEEVPYEVEHQFAEGVPSYLMKNQWTGCSWVFHQIQLFLISPSKGTPLCMVVQAK